jgi:predicted dehydrogenase
MGSARPLRGALIGCGFVSQYHLAAWREQAGAALVAVCDLDPERLKQAVSIVPDARAFRDAERMLAEMPLDFVEICTRPESHLPLVSLAARHGAHVLCQKPAALERADLLAMIEVCERAGVRLMFHENWRFRPWNRALRAAIDAGAIGRPLRLRLFHRDTRALKPGGFADQPYFTAMPRLILLEMGCHLADTARYLMGEAESVAATLDRFGTGHVGEDLATLSIRFASGALGLLDMTWCAPPNHARPEWALNDTAIEGTSGTVRVALDGTLQWAGLAGESRMIPVDLPPANHVYVHGYQATQEHFIAGLVQGTPHETSGAETLKTMDIVWTGYRAAQMGQSLRLDQPG